MYLLVIYLLKQQARFIQDMTGRKNAISHFSPCHRFNIEEADQLGCTEGQERLRQCGKVSSNLQTNMQYGFHTRLIRFYHFPRLRVCQVFITQTRKSHTFFQGVTEMESLQLLFYPSHNGRNFRQYFPVIIRQFAPFRHNTAKVFMGQHQRTVNKITVNSYQFIVITCLEIFPGKIIVLRLRSIGCQHITQHILFPLKIPKVFMQPHSPITGSGNLVPFQVQKLIGRHIVRQDVRTFCLQHGGENDTMEYDIVFPDKMYHTGLRVFPIFFPLRGQVFGGRNITNGSIKPYIQDLALCTFQRHRHAPIQVTGYRTGLQTVVQPRLALSINIGLPFLMFLQYPFLQPIFILIQRQIPMLRLPQFRLIACNG